MNWEIYNPPLEARDILSECAKMIVASTTDELIALACGGATPTAW